MPNDSLNIVVDRLIEDVNNTILGKRELEDNDSVAVDGGVELSCNIFNMFRQNN